MLFFKTRENIWGEEEVYDAFYVDGAFITACNVFLLFCCGLMICLPIFGLADWICKNPIPCGIICSVFIALVLVFQQRTCRKKFMVCYACSTIISLIAPVLSMMLSVIPYIAFAPGFDSMLGLIFFGLIFCGGAFLFIKINALIKSGLTCLIVSVLHAILSGVVIFLFYMMLENTFTVRDMISLYIKS